MQVLQGGELDINFEIMDPYGRILVDDRSKMDNLHTVDRVGVDGTYQFCLDNTHSLFSEKVVYFDLLIYDPQAVAEVVEPAPDKDAMVVELDIKLSDMLVSKITSKSRVGDLVVCI